MSGNQPMYGAYPYPFYPQFQMRQQVPFPSQFQQQPSQQPPGASDIPGMLPLEQSYIENILRLNKGKLATFYLTFEGNSQWNAKTFTGRIEAAGRDHIILSQPETGRRVLLLMVYLDYVIFEEEINYEYPYTGTTTDQLTTYAPRK